MDYPTRMEFLNGNKGRPHIVIVCNLCGARSEVKMRPGGNWIEEAHAAHRRLVRDHEPHKAPNPRKHHIRLRMRVRGR